MNKVFISRDFLYENIKCQLNNLNWVTGPMKFQIEQAINDKIETFNFDTDNNFFREIFFSKSNIDFDKNENKFVFDSSKINSESLDYLKEFLNDSLIIGYELSFDTQNILDKINVTYINFYNHSIHYLDDMFFAVRSNNREIHEKLLCYKIDERIFNVYANYHKTFIDYRDKSTRKSNSLNIEQNSALLCAQTLRDKSVEFSGKFLNLLDYKKEIEELSKSFSRIYYVPHPNEIDCKIQREINSYIKNCSFITIISNFSAYEIISHNNIKKVVALSSSILYEAFYFGKEIQYLFRPFFYMSDDFGSKNFVGIYNDYFKISFWSKILSPVINTDKEVKDIDFLSHNNRVRHLRPNQLYWGYKDLDYTYEIALKKFFSKNKKKKKNKNTMNLLKNIIILIGTKPYKYIINPSLLLKRAKLKDF